MLPFLKNNKDATVGSDSAPIKMQTNDDKEPDSLELAMQELHTHLGSSDWKSAAECFRAAIDLCGSEPEEQDV
jgi:hypothetical protein